MQLNELARRGTVSVLLIPSHRRVRSLAPSTHDEIECRRRESLEACWEQGYTGGVLVSWRMILSTCWSPSCHHTRLRTRPCAQILSGTSQATSLPCMRLRGGGKASCLGVLACPSTPHKGSAPRATPATHPQHAHHPPRRPDTPLALRRRDSAVALYARRRVRRQATRTCNSRGRMRT